MPLIGTLNYNWPMSAHVSQAFSTWNVPIWKIYYELGVTHGDCDIPDIAPTIRARCFLLVGSSRTWSGWSFRLQPVKKNGQIGSDRVWRVAYTKTIFCLVFSMYCMHLKVSICSYVYDDVSPTYITTTVFGSMKRHGRFQVEVPL